MTESFERLQAGLPERYTLDREIGRGGMATVFLARERHPNRMVAIKTLDPAVGIRLGRERFLREIDFVSNLTHPHIVPIFAAGEANGLLFYVMPFVEGESLRELIRREGPLTITSALRIACHVAGALQYAHRHNVIHRDIKPDNILLNDGNPVVTDFGVGRALTAAGDETITETGLTLGTPAYMSPEQAAGRDDIDGRADVYALGCVLYEMLVGQPPFGRGPPEAVLRRQITAPPPLPSEKKPSIPQDVDYAVRKALAKDRAQRYETAADFEATLDRLRSGLNSGSGFSVTGDVGGTGNRWRRPAAWIAAGAALVALTWQLSPRNVYPVLAAPLQYVDSVAVMPVVNLTGDSTLDHLSDAITHGTIRMLSRLPDLKLPSYVSVHAASEDGFGISKIVDALQVRLILAPQFRRVGNQVRLDAEIFEGLSGTVVHSGSWTVDITDQQGTERGLIGRLAELVSDATGLANRPERTEGIHGPAHETYLLGKHWLGRRTPEGVKRAINLFQAARTLDSMYAPAYEGLSAAYVLALVYRYEIGFSGYDAAGRALTAANHAIELDRTFAEAYAARGLLVSLAFGPAAASAADFERALELSPNMAQVLAWSGVVLGQQGKNEEALAASRRGVDLDPFAPGRHFGFARTAMPLERYDIVIEEARRASALEPEILEARAIEGRALVLAGRADECLAIEFAAHEGVRALCLHALGQTEEAATLIDSLVLVTRTGTGDTLYTDVTRADDLATYYAWTGDTQSALDWIERAFRMSPMGIDRRLLFSPLFDTIRQARDGRNRLDEITGSVWNNVERSTTPVGATSN